MRLLLVLVLALASGGIAQAEQGRNVAHAQFGAGQRVENSDPGQIAEDFEGFGERRRRRFAKQLSLDCMNI